MAETKSTLAPPDEHPAAKRMREKYEAQHGDMTGIVLAMRGWRNTCKEYNDPWNRDREHPVSEDDVDTAEKAVFDAVRARDALSAPSPTSALPGEYPPLPAHEPTIAIQEILNEYLDEDDKTDVWESIQAYADIHARTYALTLITSNGPAENRVKTS